MDRIKRGYVLIHGKKHFIYNDVNIIGRHKGAAVIVPHTSVSHYHSSVVVIEDRHYICDTNSSNGTCLDERTLTPFKLYELNSENILKFGLVDATYYKLPSTDTQVINFENGETDSIQYDEHLFTAGTQIYNIPRNNSQNFEPKSQLGEPLESTSKDKNTFRNFKKPGGSQLPEQAESTSENETIMQNIEKPKNSQLCELEESTNGDEATTQNSIALSINDMPTQVIADDEFVSDDAREEKDSCKEENKDATKYVLIHDMPTQIVLRREDDLLEHVDPHEGVSHVIEETVIEDKDGVDDENSNESTDLLTMQPATQRFASDPESQLFVQSLQRRVRRLISSSEEYPSNSNSQKKDSSGEETDIECAMVRRRQLTKKKPIITSDSDGDSTDAEEVDVSNPKEVPPTEDCKNSDSDTDVETTCVAKITTDVKANAEDIMNDSDIIPTTQQDATKDTKEQSTESYSHQNEIKRVLVDDNEDTTLTESFHLVLTNTEHLDDETQSIDNEIGIEKHSAIKENDANESATTTALVITDKNSNEEAQVSNTLDNKVTNDIKIEDEPQTQLEVGFDDNLIQTEVNTDRPQNPLLSVLDDSKSSELDDSIEDKLAKMFQTQISEEAPPKEYEDEVFGQPTQIININESEILKDKDVFLVPTRRVVSKQNIVKINEVTGNNDNEEDDDIFFKPTQIVSTTVISEDTTEYRTTSDEIESVDDIFLKPTQVIDGKSKIINTPTLQEDVKFKIEGDDDLFLQPTQVVRNNSEAIENLTADITKSNIVSDVIEVKEDIATNNETGKGIEDQDDDIFSVSTQMIDLKSGDSSTNIKTNVTKSDLTSNLKNVFSETTVKESLDGAEDAVTQNKINSTLPKTGEGNTDNVVEDIFSLSTQIVDINVLNTQQDKIKEKIFEPAEEHHSIKAKKRNCKKKEPIVKSDNNNIDMDSLDATTSADAKCDESSTKETKPEVIISTKVSEGTSKRKKSKRQVENLENKRTKRQKLEKGNASSSKIKETPQRAIPTPPMIENKILRRSRRKNSNAEKSERTEVEPVVQETPSPSTSKIIPNESEEANLHPSTNSEDEFVDAAQWTPLKTRMRVKQISSVESKQPEQSISKNTLEVNDNPIRVSSRVKRKSPETESNIGKILLEHQTPIESNEQRTAVTPIKQRKVQTRGTRTRKLIVEKQSETENNQVNEEQISNENNTENNISAEASTSRTPSAAMDNKVRISLRSKTKGIEHVSDQKSNNTNSNDLEILRDDRKPSNSTRKSKKKEKLLQESSEASESSSDIVNAPPEATKKSTVVRSSNSSTVASESTNNRRRGSRMRNSCASSDDDFEVSNIKSGTALLKPAPCTPNRMKRILKPKVVFTMLESPGLETIIRSLGGFVVDSLETSTVVLTTSVKRSQKLLSAVGQSKPICSPRWLHDSKRANKFLDPWDYILEDEEAETKWNFSLKESLRRSVQNKLLKDYTFLIMTNAAQDVLKGSIESCGGKCVSRAPSKDQQTNFVIIASPDNKSKYSRYLKQKPPPKIIAAEAVFDGVLRQELHFEEHLLT